MARFFATLDPRKRRRGRVGRTRVLLLRLCATSKVHVCKLYVCVCASRQALSRSHWKAVKRPDSMAPRPRFQDVAALVGVLKRFVTRPDFIHYEPNLVSKLNHKALVGSRDLLVALRDLNPGLSFTQKMMKVALSQVYKEQWALSDEQRKRWEDVIAKRVRAMCRHLSQSARRPPIWYRLHFWREGDAKVADGEEDVGDSFEFSFNEDESDHLDSDNEVADEGFYGWCYDHANAYRRIDKKTPRLWAREILIPKDAHKSDAIEALFIINDEEKVAKIADMTVEEYEHILTKKRNKLRGSASWTGTSEKGERLQVRAKKDRMDLIVIERYDDAKKKFRQILQVRSDSFPDEATGVKFMTSLAEDCCAGKISGDNLKQ